MACKNQDKFGYAILDSDIAAYEKLPGREERYVKGILEHVNSGKYDFVLINQTEAVLNELDKQGRLYVIVEPDNIIWNSEIETPERARERQLIKQQWFGRFVLGDNSHIKDFDRWLNEQKATYDELTSLEFINRHNQKTFFTLKADEYLSDIIEDLYWKKVHYLGYDTEEK